MFISNRAMLLSFLFACTSNKDSEETDDTNIQDTEETDTEDTDTDDSDSGDTSETDTGEPAPGSVAVTIYDAAGNLVDGVSVQLGEMEGTTVQGLYTFEDVSAETLFVLTANPQDSIELETNVIVAENTSLEVPLVIPETQNAAVTPDGTEQTLEFSGLSLDLDSQVGFVDTDGNSYSGEVSFVVATEMDPLSLPNPVDLDSFGNPLGCPPTLSSIFVKSVTSTGAELQPTSAITLSAPVSSYDTSQPIALESFNPETGLWQEDAIATFNNGIVSAQVDHFTHFRFVNGEREDYSGMRVEVIDSSGSGQASQIDWECTSPAGHQEAGSYSGQNLDDFCVMVPKDSICTVSADVQTIDNIEVSNDCVCSANPDTCNSIQIDLSTAVECGNGIVETGEGCDDGDTDDGDGCDANCQPENCTIEYSGGLNSQSQYFTIGADCDFYYSTDPAQASSLVLSDVAFDPLSFDHDAANDWIDYASSGGTVLGLFNFFPAYTLGDSAMQITNARMGHSAIGILKFDSSTEAVAVSSFDTTNQTFDITINMNLFSAASSYPPLSGTTNLFDLGSVSDGATIHITGKYNPVSQ